MLQENKKYKIILISLFLLGAVLIVIGSLFGKGTSNEYKTKNNVEDLEKNLEAFILNVEGISNVDVIISMEAYSDTVPTYSIGSNNDTVVYSKVIGVCVACTGGNDDRIKKEVTEIVSSYLGIGSNKVKITSIKR